MKSLRHVAIIMDGNGRWAKKRAHNRFWGHVRGAQRVSSIIEEADAQGLEALTLYAFSQENWSRPKSEIENLFKLLKKFLIRETDRLLNNNVCFKVIGDIEQLPLETQSLIKSLEQRSKNNIGLKLNFAFGYSSRTEMIEAINEFISSNPGKLIREEDLELNLQSSSSGPVDLLIRTGGDLRVSNFLLWQIAYAELFFSSTPWPEFSREEFIYILKQVSMRERRFGMAQEGRSFDEAKMRALENKNDFISKVHSGHP